jgi:hypothetical protein
MQLWRRWLAMAEGGAAAAAAAEEEEEEGSERDKERA